MSEQQLLLAPVEPVLELELVEGTIAEEPVDVSVIAAPAPVGRITGSPQIRSPEFPTPARA